MKTTIEFGNKSATLTLKNATEWTGGDNVRVYHEVESDNKKVRPISKFYEVLSGDSRDHKIEVEGRVFAVELGFCESKTKRSAALEAAEDLAKQVVAA